MDQQRLERMNLSLAVCLFDSSLKSSGKSGIIWGAINLLIGGVQISSGNGYGYVVCGLGLFLVVTGMYEMKVREAWVVKLSAITLGILAIWNVGGVALAMFSDIRLVLGGKALIWGIFQAIGAYNTWQTYAVYKTLLEHSDAMTLEEVKRILKEAEKIKPKENSEIIVFQVSPTLGDKHIWRLVPVEDVLLSLQYKKELRESLESAAFLEPDQIKIDTQGEKFLSKNLKAKLTIAETVIEDVTIEPEMLARMEKIVGHSANITDAPSSHSF